MDLYGRVQWTYRVEFNGLTVQWTSRVEFNGLTGSSSMDLQGAVQGTYRVQFQVDRVLEGSGIFTVLHEGQQVSTALLPLLRVRWGLPTLPPAASALAALHKQDSCNTLHQVLMGPTCTNRTAAIHFIRS